jgi:hypothetical protein
VADAPRHALHGRGVLGEPAADAARERCLFVLDFDEGLAHGRLNELLDDAAGVLGGHLGAVLVFVGFVVFVVEGGVVGERVLEEEERCVAVEGLAERVCFEH